MVGWLGFRAQSGPHGLNIFPVSLGFVDIRLAQLTSEVWTGGHGVVTPTHERDAHPVCIFRGAPSWGSPDLIIQQHLTKNQTNRLLFIRSSGVIRLGAAFLLFGFSLCPASERGLVGADRAVRP